MSRRSNKRKRNHAEAGWVIARADVLSFEMTDGSVEKLPEAWMLFGDPSGRLIDKCTFICTKGTPSNQTLDRLPPKIAQAAADYFGEEAELTGGYVDLPSPPWHFVGVVKEIRYDRHGQFEDKWYHPFANGGEGVELYRNAARTACLLVLPDHCIVDERGFVRP